MKTLKDHSKCCEDIHETRIKDENSESFANYFKKIISQIVHVFAFFKNLFSTLIESDL